MSRDGKDPVPNRHCGSPEECRALDTLVKLVRAAESVGARLQAGLTGSGLTGSQFGTLEALYHLGPICQKELGEKLLKSSGNITMVVDNLEKRDLVRRERSSADRRYITVHLTDAGRRLFEEIFPTHVAAVVREMEVLTPEEQALLGRLCKSVGKGIRTEESTD